MSRSRIAALAIITVLMSGCGTVCNLASGQPEVYGGVGRALVYNEAVQASSRDQPESSVTGSSPLVLLWDLAWRCPDVCASAVGDTVTIPLVLASMPRKASCAPAASEDYWRLPAQYAAGATTATPVTPPADNPAPSGQQGK